jgi:hypothetical protein
MDASFDHDSPLRELVPGRFTRVSVQTPAGEIEARLSERGYWQLRVRHDLATRLHRRPRLRCRDHSAGGYGTGGADHPRSARGRPGRAHRDGQRFGGTPA